MEKKWAGIGSVVMGLGVVAGAFGAHGLRGVISPEMMIIYEKGVFYHLIHGLAIILSCQMVPTMFLSKAGASRICMLFLVGIVIFSGSLYALAISGQRWLGAITPIGGVSFIVAWALLGYSLLRGNSANKHD